MTTVIKIGGSILNDGSSESLLESISQFRDDKVVLVHGGGPAVTDLCKNLGIEPRFVLSPDGIRSRLTDGPTMEAFIMALRGKINSQIVLSMQKRGLKAFGMSGMDGPTLIAERKKRLLTVNEKGRKMFIDGGYTGRIVQVEGSLVNSLLSGGFTPVMAPIAVSQEYEPLNVDGDRAASALAGAIKADRLILFTNVDGVLLNGSLVRKANSSEIPEMLKRVGNGMDKKLIAAREAIEAGASEVIISNGNVHNAVGNAVSSENRTVIRK